MNDLIGLLLSVGVFIFLMIRSALKKNQPEDEDEEVEIPPPPPRPVKKQKFHPPQAPQKPKKQTIEERYSENSIVSGRFAHAEAYEVIGKEHPSRARQLIRQLKSKKDMVILNEIIGPPKGFR